MVPLGEALGDLSRDVEALDDLSRGVEALDDLSRTLSRGGEGLYRSEPSNK